MKPSVRQEMHSVVAAVIAFLFLPTSAHALDDAAQTAQAKELFGKSMAAYRQGDFAKSQNYMDEALRVKPNSYRLYAMRGFYRSKAGKYSQAAEDLKHAATCAREQGKIEDSQKFLAKATEYDSLAKNPKSQPKAAGASAAWRGQSGAQQTTKAGTLPAQKKPISSTTSPVSQ